MSEGERMIWAAAYASNIHYDWPGHGSQQEWEQNMISTAIENAWAAVANFRDAEKNIVEGWGGLDVHFMYMEMYK